MPSTALCRRSEPGMAEAPPMPSPCSSNIIHSKEQSMKTLIVGAGIGGLTTALFLHRAGIEVEVFERADLVRELGVGINMLPHAVGLLAELGLMDALEAAGIRTRELIYANRFGQVVWQELRGTEAGHAVPQFSI